MKKGFIIPMAVSLLLTASSISAFAKSDNNYTTAPAKTAISITTTKAAAISAKSISGIVTDVSENDITIKGSDGTEYWFPTIGYSSINNFNKLNMKAGDEITIKGIVAQIGTLNTDSTQASSLIITKVGPINISQLKLQPGTNLNVTTSTAIALPKVDLKNAMLAPILIKGIKTFTFSLKDHPNMKLIIPQEITSNGITVDITNGSK